MGLAIAFLVALVLAGDFPVRSATYAPLLHPFRDARLFVDQDTAAAQWQAGHSAQWLDEITRNPQAHWLNNPQDLNDVSDLARRAQDRGELLVLVAYYVPNRDCAGLGAPSNGDYAAFIEGLIGALGPVRAAIMLEPDAVAADCFNSDRAALLRQAVRRLAEAGQHVYLDAGHPGWRSVGAMARRLLQAGVAGAEGFAVNVANRQTTKDSYRWARALSHRLGEREFVIDTSRNGLGPPAGRHARSGDWCNPEREALGAEPTTTADKPGLAALLWIKPPGESDGTCGGETGNHFSPNRAQNLIRNMPPR